MIEVRFSLARLARAFLFVAAALMTTLALPGPASAQLSPQQQLLAPAIRDIFFRPGADGQPVYIPSDYKGARGGRGSGKSWGFARVLIMMSSVRKLRVLCAREFQNSIEESVHKLLSDQIEGLGLGRYFEVQQRVIKSVWGGEFIFEGLSKNITKIKSMEGIDICWVEEAEKVSSSSWEILIPTIRKSGAEIWITWNPVDPADPTNVKFIENPPPGARIAEVNWTENPWFPERLRKEKEYAYATDPDAASHVWGGKYKLRSKAQVLNGKWVIDSFDPIYSKWDGPYFGADWGFAQDPTTLVKCWIFERKLYIDYEAYGVGVDIDKTPELFDSVPGGRSHTVRGDSARPETISYLQRHGYGLVTSVEKWPGSVEDGVAFLRSFEQIVIHQRCQHAAEEARLWSYKVDKLSGDVLPVLVDNHNHIWDAVRYALAPMIRKRDGILDFVREQAEDLDKQRQAEAAERIKALIGINNGNS